MTVRLNHPRCSRCGSSDTTVLGQSLPKNPDTTSVEIECLNCGHWTVANRPDPTT